MEAAAGDFNQAVGKQVAQRAGHLPDTDGFPDVGSSLSCSAYNRARCRVRPPAIRVTPLLGHLSWGESSEEEGRSDLVAGRHDGCEIRFYVPLIWNASAQQSTIARMIKASLPRAGTGGAPWSTVISKES